MALARRAAYPLLNRYRPLLSAYARRYSRPARLGAARFGGFLANRAVNSMANRWSRRTRGRGRRPMTPSQKNRAKKLQLRRRIGEPIGSGSAKKTSTNFSFPEPHTRYLTVIVRY